jgi:hypothetical protein
VHGKREEIGVKCGARVALGVAGGYFLGRTKKMKLALMLGGMAAGRKAGGPGELLAQGTKLLNRSPELSQLSDQFKGRLLDAGKQAALAAAARQVESLTDRVSQRAASFGERTKAGAGAATDVAAGAAPAPPDVEPPDSAPADSAPSDSTPSDSASPDSASPDSASPDSASPDSASPDSASPDSASPDSASPDSTSPDSASPDSASPDSTPAATGTRESAPPARRRRQSGDNPTRSRATGTARRATGGAGGTATRAAGKATSGRGGRSTRTRKSDDG